MREHVTLSKKLNFSYFPSSRMLFGEGATNHIKNYLQRRGVKRAFLITDEGLRNTKMLSDIMKNLGELCVGVYDEVVPDPGIQIIARGAEKGRQLKVDAILSVGGGSSIDAAKCIAALLTKNRADISEFFGFGRIGEPVLPHVAVPTTAGTGSEAVSLAMVKSEKENVKYFIGDKNLTPQMAILDPCMTLTLPEEVTGATGVDALSHAIESIYSEDSEPISDALAVHAIRLIAEYLPECLANGSDIEARGMQLIASYMAGMAFQNAHVGVVHALAHAVGGISGVTHGIANGIFLPYGLEFNGEMCPEKYRLIAPIFGIELKGAKGFKIAEELSDRVSNFVLSVGLPQRLSEVGVKEEQLKTCAEIAFADPVMASNPRKIQNSDPLLRILKKAY